MILHNEITAECRPGTYEGPTLLIRALDALPLIAGKMTDQVRTADSDALPIGTAKVTDQEGTGGIDALPIGAVKVIDQESTADPNALPIGAAKVTNKERTGGIDALPIGAVKVIDQERTADLGWGAYIPHGLTIRNIPGNHVSVMARPWVKELARSLAEWTGITEKNQPE
jgi:hypothetical protein